MVAVTIAARIENFDSAVEKYVYNRDIHLENAMSVLQDRRGIKAFDDVGQYDSVIKTAEDIMNFAGISADEKPAENMSIDEMEAFLEGINRRTADLKSELEAVRSEISSTEEIKKRLETVKDINIDLSGLLNMQFIATRFGHIPKGGYRTLTTYLEHIDALFVKTSEDQDGVWGFYFAPRVNAKRADDVFNSLYFERVMLPKELKGNPKQMKQSLDKKETELSAQAQTLEKSMRDVFIDSKEKIAGIYNTAKKYRQFSTIRKNAVHSKEFFYVVGWMSRRDAQKLEADAGNDPSIVLYLENAEDVKRMTPPTKLKNPRLFRPFEFFVKMYGLPSYKEADPTPLMAVTYFLFFGMMFGDVGQSVVLGVIGFILYKVKKWDLCGIIAAVGVSGTIFGFIYGSVFGNETLLENVRILNPMDSIWTLLLGTIAMGIFIIMLGICINIFNQWRAGNKGEMLFGHNGVAGLLFYASLMAIAIPAVPAMLFKSEPLYKAPTGILAIVMIAALLCMFFEQPLSLLADGRKKEIKLGGMFFVESFFELFEVLLSFFSNTISFLRIGAFAIVHAGMMMAVSVLAGDGGVGTVIVQVLGNILVMVLEGLIVGIQVLRLEYYEMFSRYFEGSGKPFKSLRAE